MKALLMVAGFGTRLKPLTDHRPKCLMKIGEKPLLELWFLRLYRSGVRSILVNTHYLADQVEDFIKDFLEKTELKDIQITIRHEKTLLGSAGTIVENYDFIEGKEDFFVIYGDNLCNYKLELLRKAHEENKKKGALLTMALFKAENPSACGIVELDKDNRLKSFKEKPENPDSDLANAGIYMASPEIREKLEKHLKAYPYDLGKDLFPHMEEYLFGLPMQGYLKDIGTLEALKEAEKKWPEIKEDFL